MAGLGDGVRRVRQVAVCGPAECGDDERAQAYRIGVLLAEHEVVVLCGGGAGVMAGVVAGVRDAGGLVVGVRPDLPAADSAPTGTARAQPEPSVTIWTGIGQARNAIIVSSAAAVIAIGSSWGTLSEVALARRSGVPVVWLGGWRILDRDGRAIDGVATADSPEAAVEFALGATAVRPGPQPG